MNEIMKKTYELIDVLEESDLIRDLVRYRDKIQKNEELCELIRKGNSVEDEYQLLDIRRKVYQNEDYRGYMEQYNQLMYLVMDINARYRALLKERSCYRCE